MEVRGVQPNEISYSAAISACEKGQQWERALGLLAQMEEHGVQPNVISYSAAISACEKGQQWERALALLAQMEARGLELGVATFTAVMQVLVSSSQLDEAFHLLQRIHDSPIAATSYVPHHVLLNGCRSAGDARAAEVQAAINRFSLSSLAAVVKFTIEGDELQTVNGTESRALDDAVEELFRKVLEQTAYSPQYEALPMAFVQRFSEAAQVKSLKYHSEKKALASLLLHNASELTMRVNVKVCADCHSFLEHAGQLLGRPINVLEPSRQHVFRDGGCSCDGRGY